MPMPLHSYALGTVSPGEFAPVLVKYSCCWFKHILGMVSFASSAWFGGRVEDYLCFLVTLYVDKSVVVARFSI